MKQSSPFFVASTTALLLTCFCSPGSVEAAAGHGSSSASATSSSLYSCSSASSSLSVACAGIDRKQPTQHSSRRVFGIGVAGDASAAASTCRKGLTLRGGDGGDGKIHVFQDPAVKNDFFGTPNTFVPAAYPWFDLAFMVGYAGLIYAMPGSVDSLHKMIHIAWEVVHMVLVGMTNYGVRTFFPNRPALPLKLMYSFDASWTVFVALMPFILDQGSGAWNLFWHIAGVVSLLSVTLLDFKADVRKGSD